MENREYARLLTETADLMEIAGEDGFRIRSYRNAASALEGTPERVDDLLSDPAKKVTDIAGIGKGIGGALGEIKLRGSFEARDRMLALYPPTALELLKIQGLGPKSIRTLWEHFRVSTIDDLEKLCQEHRLRELPRMGAKLEEKVLRSIEQYRHRVGRYLLSYADQMASELVPFLAAVQGVETVTPAGSLRRGKETVGDLDIVVTGPGAGKALETFLTFPRLGEVLGSGPTKASARIGNEGLQVDVRAVPTESLGAAMQYFTGSKEHNVLLRTRAVKMGLTLNEYGLVRVSDGVRVASATEAEIYAVLGMDYVAPEMRENSGEVEAATEHRLPKLIELGEIRGDLHMHTTETDGRATLEEMAAAAAARGYEYIAITDHSKALAMANGLNEERVVAFAKKVRELNESGHLPLKILSGLECDIRREGEMDIEWDALAELDFVVASVHSYMNQEAAEMTDRLLKCLECPWVRVLGHPTGRILMHRDGYPYDFERVATEAAARKVAMEINASPERLDIHGPLIRSAKAKGVKFLINTDAHHPAHLLNMRFGVTMARRGWLEAGDVLNTLPYAELRKAITKS